VFGCVRRISSLSEAFSPTVKANKTLQEQGQRERERERERETTSGIKATHISIIITRFHLYKELIEQSPVRDGERER